MKLSLNWIKKYVDLPEDLTIDRLSYDLTMRTVEVEGSENLRDRYENIVAGKILKVEAHPKADLLRKVTVDVGPEGEKVIICGGSNLFENQMVVVAKPGSHVVWHGEGEPVVIKETKLRGEPSWGMICGANEIGLEDIFPSEGEREIVDLKGIDCKSGDNIADILGLDDIILEIDNKSMTNRPDLWGHYGIARELSAIYGLELKKLPEFTEKNGEDRVEVEIEDPELTRRYAGLTIKNVKADESPLWLKTDLLKVGMRPINVIVDITNYIMLAVGQPTHGFDRKHVEGKITVRNARENEVLTLLDGKELKLEKDSLVIADDKKAIGLAGIMGGKWDSINDDTDEIILEAANFSPKSIRHTTQKFQIRTEASSRFEKSIDTQRVDQALGLAQYLFHELLPGSVIAGYTENYPVKTENADIRVSLEFLSSRLGEKLSSESVEKLLSLLGFKTIDHNDEVEVIAPTWRSTGDISIKDDILEEVARMYGYENVEYKAPVVSLDKPVRQLEFDKLRRIKEYLAFQYGFREVFTYPWTDIRYIEAAGLNTQNMVALATPPSPETRFLRSSLVPGMLETVVTNIRYFEKFSVFEATEVFEKGSWSPSDPVEVLPVHKMFVTGACYGNNVEELFFTVKGAIENMGRNIHSESLTLTKGEVPSWAEKDICLEIRNDKEVIGHMGLVKLKVKNALGIKKGQIVMFEFNADSVKPLPSRTNTFEHLPLFPLVEQDLSLLLDESVSWERIEKLIRPMVKTVEFVEEYKGKQIPKGKKSVLLRVHFGSDKGTLTTEEIDSKMAAIIKKLTKEFSAEVRGI